MANVYHLSMGFVWPTTGSYKGWGGELLNGAVLANPGTTPTVSDFEDLDAEDQIQFWIYDLSNGSTGSGATLSVTGTFPNGDQWILISPTSDDTVLFSNGGSGSGDPPSLTSGIQLQSHGPFASVYFATQGYTGTYPCWTLVATANQMQPLAGVVDPNDTDDPGTFNVNLQVSISNGGTTVIYGHDPEMVVTPGNQ